VNGDYASELNVLLDAEMPPSMGWNLAMAIHQLHDAGFRVTGKKENSITIWFSDVGAVMCILKAIPWQIPNFTIDRYKHELERLHKRMTKNNGLVVNGTLFYVEAL
jgi:DNA-binding helix-hairpin-helix protein with protein kinase domain